MDQFQLPNGGAEAFGVTVDGSGNVHVTGIAWSSGSSPLYHWITRQRSAATGAWSTADLFYLAANQTTWGRAITADPSGNLFAAGYGVDSASAYHGWIVRRKLAP